MSSIRQPQNPGIGGLDEFTTAEIQVVHDIAAQGVQSFSGYSGISGYSGYSGATGEGFLIAKTYATVAALTADTSPTGINPGEFALVVTVDPADAENGRLYLWSAGVYTYTTDMSVQGIQGNSGISGYSGYSGISGYSGFSGISGYSGYSGISGYSGTNGTSGYSGFSGISGYSGATGTTGTSGYSGYSGISGYSGYSGISGYSGFSGISGYSGSGISGYSGYSGIDGGVAASGYSGFSGISGYSGANGAAGTSGYSGYSGISGYSGANGATGTSGYSGYSGISGYSGFSGISGYSGFSGISGYSGATGATGTSGYSGYSGIGTSGYSGYSGVAGSVLDGTPNTNQTSNGTSTNTFNAGATIATTRAVYLSSSSTWLPTQAAAAATSAGMLGITLEAGTAANPLSVALPGSFVRDDSWAWTPGGTIYLVRDTLQFKGLGSFAGGAGDQNAIAVGYPTGILGGDIIFVQLQLQSGGGSAWDVPAGWTQVDTNRGAMAVMYKVADGSETGSVTFSIPGGNRGICGQMSLIAGANASPNGGSNGSTTTTITTITPSAANTLWMYFGGRNNNPDAFSAYAMATSNPTWTEAYDTSHASAITIAMAYSTIRSATTGSGNITATATAASGAIAIAVLPPTVPGGNLSQTAPVGAGSIVRKVGYAVTADVMFFEPSDEYTTL